MSIDPTIAVLYAQTGYTARVVHEAATAPQTAGAMARVMAEESSRQEQRQVQSAQKSDESRVADKEGERGRGQSPFNSRRRNRSAPPAENDDESPDRPDSPLVGNFLNLKV